MVLYIVGVVGDVKYNGMADDVQPALYQPAAQQPTWGGALVIKTDPADPLSLMVQLCAMRSEKSIRICRYSISRRWSSDSRAAVAQPRSSYHSDLASSPWSRSSWRVSAYTGLFHTR